MQTLTPLEAGKPFSEHIRVVVVVEIIPPDSSVSAEVVD